MLKYALLAGALTIAVPVLAQTATTSPQAMPRTAPAGSASSADPSTAQAASAQGDSSTAQAATQPASADQVAQVVDTEFPTYDTNRDGTLSVAEFGGWMVALKTKTDPTTKAAAPETKKWVAAAFAQADTDKSKSLTKPELTSFLSKG